MVRLSRHRRDSGFVAGPVLARVPAEGSANGAFDELAARVQALSLARPLRVLVVTGERIDEAGAVAAGLAGALERAGLDVATVAADADVARLLARDYVIVQGRPLLDGMDEPTSGDALVLVVSADRYESEGPALAAAASRLDFPLLGVVLTGVAIEREQVPVPSEEPPWPPRAGTSPQAELGRAEQTRREEESDRLDAAELEQRVAELDERAAELDSRELRLAEQGERLAKDRAELAQRRRSLDDLARAAARRRQEMDGLQAQLVERRRALDELARSAASYRESLERGDSAEPLRDEPPAPAGLPADAQEGRVRLGELERLVERHAVSNPSRLAEWEAYLFYLRDYAEPDGRLPATFDSLVEEVFGDLLEAAP